MTKIEVNSRQASRTFAIPRTENSSVGSYYRLLFALVGLATIAMILVTDNSWAQLQEGDEVVTVTNAYWVRLRSTPAISPDTILTRVAGGAQLKYLGTQDEWFQVELPDGAQGWLHSRYGRRDSARNLLSVSASVARIRERPEPNSPVIGRAIQGLMLEVLEKSDPWYLVRLPLGEEGWVRQDLVTMHEVKPKPQPSQQTSVKRTALQKAPELPAELSIDEATGTNLLEITPLPISATASSVEEEVTVSSPALRSPQNGNKPRFLMLFLSVIAGLSLFAVILVVGAVAIRRRQDRGSSEVLEKDSSPPLSGEYSTTEYSDPLLGLRSKRSALPAGNRFDHRLATDDESIPLDESEALSFSAQEEEKALPEIRAEEPAPLPEPELEEKIPATEIPVPAAAAPAISTIERTEEDAASTNEKTRSSRSRNRRKGKKRRRRR